MRRLGKDKFKIDLFEEGVFSSTDAPKATIKFWMRERGAVESQKEPLTREIGTQMENAAPESYYTSDEEQEAIEVPADLPIYDLL